MTSFAPGDLPALDWKQSVIEYLKRSLAKGNLETFKEDLEHKTRILPYSQEDYEIQEIKPPRNGIAYSCTYDRHTMASKPPMKSSYAHIEQYWDKDGECIGFSFEGQQSMFTSKNTQVETTLPQNMQDTLNTYWENRANIRSLIPKGSDLEKFIKKHPLANINIKTNKDGTIHVFEVVYDTRMGQVGRRGKFGILYGEMIESYATFDWNGTFISESERTRDAGIKSANFKSGQEKIKMKTKVKQASVIKTLNNDR